MSNTMISGELVTHAVTTTRVSAGSNRSFWVVLIRVLESESECNCEKCEAIGFVSLFS